MGSTTTSKCRGLFRLQFSLRTLLLATAMLAGPLALFANDLRIGMGREAAKKKLLSGNHRMMVHGDDTPLCIPSWRASVVSIFIDREALRQLKQLRFEGAVNDDTYALIQYFPEVELLQVRNGRLSREAAASLGRLPRLNACMFEQTQIDAGGLQAFVDSAENLEHLYVYGIQVVGLNECDFSERLPKMRALSIQSSAYTGENLTTLTCYDTLEGLSLMYCTGLSPHALKPIDRFSKLTGITLCESVITAEHLRDISKMRNLTFLQFRGGKLPREWPNVYFRCPNMYWLDLGNTSLNDEQWKSFQGCTGVEVLFLDRCKISDDAFDSFELFPNLERLYLSGNNLNGAKLKALCHCPRLEVLVLSDNDLSQATFPEKCNLIALEGLFLDNTKISEANVLSMISGCAGLKDISLKDTAITDATIERLVANEQLRFLDVSGTQISLEGVRLLLTCKNLTESKLPISLQSPMLEFEILHAGKDGCFVFE